MLIWEAGTDTLQYLIWFRSLLLALKHAQCLFCQTWAPPLQKFNCSMFDIVWVVYDKKSDEGSNSVRMRPENSGALKVVKKWLSTRVSDSSDAQLSDYV